MVLINSRQSRPPPSSPTTRKTKGVREVRARLAAAALARRCGDLVRCEPGVPAGRVRGGPGRTAGRPRTGAGPERVLLPVTPGRAGRTRPADGDARWVRRPGGASCARLVPV